MTGNTCLCLTEWTLTTNLAGTRWAQVGDSLDETFVIDYSGNETETHRYWGEQEAVAVSSDGNMLVVSAAGMSYYNPCYQQRQ
jgi:hypothetical protein